jgi:uncharacterized damage-inducible protein DinB
VSKKSSPRRQARRKTSVRKPVRKAARRPPAKRVARAAAPPKGAARAAAPAHSPKHEFLDAFRKEHATTKKVISAFPPQQHAFRPHERSNSAAQLIWTFAVEQALGKGAIEGTLAMPPALPPMPDRFEQVVEGYERSVQELDRAISRASDAALEKSVPFFVGPGTIGPMPVMDLLWMMLMDSVHHRGQLSVYVRMAGGRVPSIYGPSADEPWM